MKVGDLVILSPKKTRKGLFYEDKMGIVTKIILKRQGWLAKVLFDGVTCTIPYSDLKVVCENG